MHPKYISALLGLFLSATAASGQVPHLHYQIIFDDMLKILHLDATKISLVPLENQGGVAKADSVNGGYKISIRQSYLDQYPDVVFIGTICHELGHVALHHTGERAKSKEVEADSTAGCFMRRLGFQRPEDAFEFLETPVDETKYYPSKEDRKEMIMKGWFPSDSVSPVFSYVGYNPLIKWETANDTLYIQVNERVIKDPELIKYDFGIFYDSFMMATYQLDNFTKANGFQGVGRVITNRTTLVYRRTGSGYFILYDKGEIVPRLPCFTTKKKRYYINYNNDLEISCENDRSTIPTTYILRYYKFASKNSLFPAYKK